MVNKFELVDEDVGVALPCAFSCDLVNEQGVWFFGCPIGGRFICDAVKIRLVCVLRPSSTAWVSPYLLLNMIFFIITFR